MPEIPEPFRSRIDDQERRSDPNDYLKPCPFCGGKALLILQCYEDENDKWFRVECENGCVMQCNSAQSETEVIEAWNRRT